MAGPAFTVDIEPRGYATVVERSEELARLQSQAAKRKSMLVFGPEGIGKTRLLEKFVRSQPLALHVSRVQSPRAMLLALIEALHRRARPGVVLPSAPARLSTSSLKGVVQRALDQYPFLLAIDHLAAPSRFVTGMIKDLNYFDRTPVFFVSRTPHMEDIGALQSMCAGKSERTELREFSPAIAREFAHREAKKDGLWASNLDQVLHSLVEWSNGNPGSIVHMLRMAQLPRYFVGDQIKVHVLYLDYRMGRRE
jgi:hypothetical protein